MKRGGGKNKGSAFERKICEILSLKVTDGKRKDVFWRSAMSGGRATVRRGDVRQAGDICAVAPEGHELVDRYYFECKFYKDLCIDRFVLQRVGPLEKFWKTACKEALKYKREPVLIAKQNQFPIFVVRGSYRYPDVLLFTKWLKEREI